MDTFSIDEFLDKQEHSNLKATIEIVEDNPSLVKITPWIDGTGCPCQFAIKVQKSAIDSVSSTGKTHFCCGKTLQIVEINFRKDETISVQDIFSQLAASSAASSNHTIASTKSEAYSSYPLPTFRETIRVESGCPFGCPPGTQCCYSPSTGKYCCKVDCRTGGAC